MWSVSPPFGDPRALYRAIDGFITSIWGGAQEPQSGSRMVQGGGSGAERAAFIETEWVDFPVVLLRRVPTVQTCAADRRDSPGAVLGPGLTCPLL